MGKGGQFFSVGKRAGQNFLIVHVIGMFFHLGGTTIFSRDKNFFMYVKGGTRKNWLTAITNRRRKAHIGLPSVRPSVRPSGSNNFKSFSQNLMISHTGLLFVTPYYNLYTAYPYHLSRQSATGDT